MPVSVTTGDPDEIILGAGVLYVAPIGTSDPANTAAVTGGSAWREVGWTDKGSIIDLQYSIEPIKVEEEFYAPKYSVVDVVASVGFAMKQFTRQNLALAMNAGANAVNDSTSLEPPAPGDELRVKLALITLDGAMWVFRRCINGENISMNRQKAPNAALLPVKFALEKPTGQEPFIVHPTNDGLI